MFHVKPRVEEFRVRSGRMGSDSSYGRNGCFDLPKHFGLTGYRKDRLSHATRVIISDGESWEHVSASHPNRTPSWDTMCVLKGLFWDKEDVVMQLHPKESEYINNHAHCLHLWRPRKAVIPTPPSIMVGLAASW